MSPEQEDPLRALRDLGTRQPDAERSRAVVASAVRAIARRRKLTERRVVVAAAVYGATLAPFAAGGLSAAYLAAAIVQAVVVFRYAHTGIF
jgi:hypothetical protein